MYTFLVNHTFLTTIAILFMIPGIGLVFLPMVPAIPYMFLIAVCFTLLDGFTHLTGLNLWVLAAIVVISILIDQLSGIVGAKYGGASRKAMAFGLVGLIIGTIAFPPFGGFMGLFAAVLLAELIFNRTRHDAIRAATGALVGSAVGTFTNIIPAVFFFILFIWFAIF